MEKGPKWFWPISEPNSWVIEQQKKLPEYWHVENELPDLKLPEFPTPASIHDDHSLREG